MLASYLLVAAGIATVCSLIILFVCKLVYHVCRGGSIDDPVTARTPLEHLYGFEGTFVIIFIVHVWCVYMCV